MLFTITVSLIKRNQKIDDLCIDVNNHNIKVAMLLTNSAKPKDHIKFREIAEQCKKLGIVSMLFFAFEAEHNSKYPENQDGWRYVDGVQLETVIQLSAKYFNFTHCGYVYKSLARSDEHLTPTKALVRDGISIVESLSNKDKVYYFMKDSAINKHDYWWDIEY